MKRLFVALGVAVGCLTLAQSGWAATTVLTFEGLQDQERIGQFYNGASGSLGSVGPNYGVTFGPVAAAFRDRPELFANEPSAPTVAGIADVVDAPAGFRGGVSFLYSSGLGQEGSVTVYDGLGATGTVLGSIALPPNSPGLCVGSPFCHWDPVGVAFAGTARSLSFSGTDATLFDELTLGSATPGGLPDAAPVAAAGGPYAGDEGSAIALAGSADDPDGDALLYAWSVTSDHGNDLGSACTIADRTAPQTTITCNDDGGYTATLSVSDGRRVTSSSARVTVADLAPVIGTRSVAGGTTVACTAGNVVSLSFAVGDAGALDRADITGSVGWGDGTTSTYAGTSFSRSHTYAAGSYTITVTADDHDGGVDSRTDPVLLRYTTAFQSPSASDGSSVFKLGSTVQLRLGVADCTGASVSTLTPAVHLRRVDLAPASADPTDAMRWSGNRYVDSLSTKRSQFCQPGVAFCAGSDLTPGTYEVKVTDPSFAPAVVPISLKR
jgi:hypothetical protein